MIWYRLHGFDIELSDDRRAADVIQCELQGTGKAATVVRTVVAHFESTGGDLGSPTPQVMAQRFAKAKKGTKNLPAWNPPKKAGDNPCRPKKPESK